VVILFWGTNGGSLVRAPPLSTINHIDGKVFVRLSSYPPPHSRLSWSLFEGPAQCTRSRHMTPWLYLRLDLSIERRYMDNPQRHSSLPVVYFLCFMVITCVLSASVLFLCLCIGVSGDYCLAVNCEVGSIPQGLLRGQGSFLFLGLVVFLFVSLNRGGLFRFIASFNLQRFLRSSTHPRYYPFGLSKSRNFSSLINLQRGRKLASGQTPCVISTSRLFRRIKTSTLGIEPSTLPAYLLVKR
jgi:hypothetical protein